MVGKSALPDLQIRPELLLCAMRESTFDELHGPFERYFRGNQKMEVIGHEDKLVEQISFGLVGEKSFEEQASPGLRLENGSALPRLGGDEVGLRVVGGVLARGFQNLPSGAKARFFTGLNGTAEAVPLQNKNIHTSSELFFCPILFNIPEAIVLARSGCRRGFRVKAARAITFCSREWRRFSPATSEGSWLSKRFSSKHRTSLLPRPAIEYACPLIEKGSNSSTSKETFAPRSSSWPRKSRIRLFVGWRGPGFR